VVMNIEPENGKQLSVNDQILVQAVSDFWSGQLVEIQTADCQQTGASF
jgi:hypothetical protein